MQNPFSPSQPQPEAFRKYIPLLTGLCILTSIALFIGISLEGSLDNWDVYYKWGAPSAHQLFSGSIWGLITSNFLHTEIWHIAFNLYWFWIFGKKIEFESNRGFYVLFILSAALVSSLAQLSFSSSTGIGLSGIGYAFFGYLWLKGRTTEAYKGYLSQNIINLFLFWLVLCILLTLADVWQVGNAAHIGGLLWGLFLAYSPRFQPYMRWVLGLGVMAILSSSLFWNPLSTAWLEHKAYTLHLEQQLDEALGLYEKILERDPRNPFALGNYEVIQVAKLSEKAYESHSNGNYEQAKKQYQEILVLDPGNEWAKENLAALPNGYIPVVSADEVYLDTIFNSSEYAYHLGQTSVFGWDLEGMQIGPTSLDITVGAGNEMLANYPFAEIGDYTLTEYQAAFPQFETEILRNDSCIVYRLTYQGSVLALQTAPIGFVLYARLVNPELPLNWGIRIGMPAEDVLDKFFFTREIEGLEQLEKIEIGDLLGNLYTRLTFDHGVLIKWETGFEDHYLIEELGLDD